MSYCTVGICGLCAGQVTVPQYWAGTQSPIPTCSKCGATERPKPTCLPILDMDPPRNRTLADCAKRFEGSPLGFGGFPGLGGSIGSAG